MGRYIQKVWCLLCKTATSLTQLLTGLISAPAAGEDSNRWKGDKTVQSPHVTDSVGNGEPMEVCDLSESTQGLGPSKPRVLLGKLRAQLRVDSGHLSLTRGVNVNAPSPCIREQYIPSFYIPLISLLRISSWSVQSLPERGLTISVASGFFLNFVPPACISKNQRVFLMHKRQTFFWPIRP